jgi:uroporphyrinogen-III synthase
MRVIVTRPQTEATAWVQALCAAGLDAVALPLIDIAPLPLPPTSSAQSAMRMNYTAWMFVSPNAVRFFLGRKEKVPIINHGQLQKQERI